MSNRRPAKIKKYRRPLNINIGLVIFGMIFIYIIICVFLYMRTDHIVGYEVKNGSLSKSNIFKGIAIREEDVVYSENSGYINYYAREGERVAYGNLVYTVDESGKLADLLNSDNLGENSLSSDDLMELKTEIVGFQYQFKDNEFQKVYDFKRNVQGTVLKLANANALENIDILNSSGIQDLVNFCYAPKSGIITYSLDGYEDLTVGEVSADCFETKDYIKAPLINNELVEPGDATYKLSLSENWSLVIPLNKESVSQLKDETYVKVKFLKNQNQSWANLEIINNADGVYAVLTFNNSMITFATDRFVDIELITDDDTGLKIPRSSIVEKEFYLIPSEYISLGGAKGSKGVSREIFDENGNHTVEFVEVSIYNSSGKEYYVDQSSLRIGDRLILNDSNEVYTISKRGTLIGVYNINKGYADFKQVNILYENEEYSIVKPNTTYGLNVYDYIVLDATTVNEDDFIY
ncbi:MAG TPA: HlyD family efflux transporter periplasmic adaptor subunit [Lachnospiraceae bacterium]|nr:HlyD family efflux transporter periplasmic adaptor subunit [Lachnospiraceae bacterium]